MSIVNEPACEVPSRCHILFSQVSAHGPGIEKHGVTVNKWAEFTVDTRRAGRANLEVSCIDAEYNNVDVLVKDNRDGTYYCRYMPKKPIKHTVMISYGSVSIPGSPFRVGATLVGAYSLIHKNTTPTSITIPLTLTITFW